MVDDRIDYFTTEDAKLIYELNEAINFIRDGFSKGDGYNYIA